MNGEDMDMESLTSPPPNTGGRVAMVNKTMELLAGLLWEPWVQYNQEKTKQQQSNRFRAYAKKVRNKRKERNKNKVKSCSTVWKISCTPEKYTAETAWAAAV